MTVSTVWPNPLLLALLHHLWQSTLFCLGVWLLTLALRRNRASTRFRLWMLASVKFLVPFALLITAGEALRPVDSTISSPEIFTMMVQGTPERIEDAVRRADVVKPIVPDQAKVPLGVKVLFGSWLTGSVLLAGFYVVGWRRVRAQVRSAKRFGTYADVPLFLTSNGVEPGVFGILRPVLLLPGGIAERLTPDQMQAIFAHELCHVRRRDNLLAAVHMVTQILFWFHPMAWWIGSRLVEEREAACDAAVLASHNDAQVYAEGILQVCRFYVEAPASLITGVSGADLRQRIQCILSGEIGIALTLRRRALLTVVVAAGVAAPLCFGVVHAENFPVLKIPRPPTPAPPPPREQAKDAKPVPIALLKEPVKNFRLVSLKPSNPYARGTGMFVTRESFVMHGISVSQIVANAYGIGTEQLVEGPRWMDSERFDIEVAAGPDNTLSQPAEALQRKILADVFGLTMHTSVRTLPVYVVSVAAAGDQVRKNESNPRALPFLNTIGPGNILALNATTTDLLVWLQRTVFDRPLVDRTGMKGRWDFSLHWRADSHWYATTGMPQPMDDSKDVSPPALQAIRDQLGLHLEPVTMPMSVLVVDHVARPKIK